MQPSEPDHYATLGLDRRCTPAQIRDAYRLLAKRFHPDVNHGSIDAIARTQELNAAYEILSDEDRREDYDRTRETQRRSAAPRSKIEKNISENVSLRIEEFIRGTTLDVRVNDPANPNGPETYQLNVPPETAPGTRFRLPREEPFAGGFVLVKLCVLPGFRFKTRGSDLRCDLRIKAERAAQGGTEMISGAMGERLVVQIPRGVGRGEVIRLSGEGLPKARGGRGDLLVRIVYRPEVRITRTSGR